MSQSWIEFLASHQDGEVKVYTEHFIRIPFYEGVDDVVYQLFCGQYWYIAGEQSGHVEM